MSAITSASISRLFPKDSLDGVHFSPDLAGEKYTSLDSLVSRTSIPSFQISGNFTCEC